MVKEFVEVENGIATTDTEIEKIDHNIDEITGGDSTRVSEQWTKFLFQRVWLVSMNLRIWRPDCGLFYRDAPGR